MSRSRECGSANASTLKRTHRTRRATGISWRDAQRMQIAPGLSVRAASLIDLIRIAEASPDPDARMFVSPLWATLERSRRYATEAPTVEHA